MKFSVDIPFVLLLKTSNKKTGTIVDILLNYFHESDNAKEIFEKWEILPFLLTSTSKVYQNRVYQNP